ncbi:MAG: hypothetical protein RLO01_20530 [Thalassobaculaceae bacterium]
MVVDAIAYAGTQVAPRQSHRRAEVHELSEAERELLILCRRAARETRWQRRVEPLSLLAPVGTWYIGARTPPGTAATLDGLIHFMRSDALHPPRFYEQCADELSFDEAWLVGLYRAFRRNDHESLVFLLVSRLGRAHAAPLHRYVISMLSCIHARVPNVD